MPMPIESSVCLESLQPSILFVDDEKPILDAHRRLMRKTGLKPFFAQSGAEGLEVLKENNIDVVVSDMKMPEMLGSEFLAKVKSTYPDTIRILLTGYSDMESTIDAINNGSIYRYLTKPWDNNDLKDIIFEAVKIKNLEFERNQLLKITSDQNNELSELNKNLENKVKERTEKLEQALTRLKKINHQQEMMTDNIVETFSHLIERHTGDKKHNKSEKGKISQKFRQKA